MRTGTIFILVFLLVSVLSSAQKIELLILAPNVTRYDLAYDSEIRRYDAEIKKNTESLNQKPPETGEKNMAENTRIMVDSKKEFSKKPDFFKQLSLFSQDFLIYSLIEKFPGEIIKLKDEKSDGSVNSLIAQSKKENLRYVLNFSSVALFKKNNQCYCKINVQFFDGKTGIILFNKSFTGDWNNQGGDFYLRQ